MPNAINIAGGRLGRENQRLFINTTEIPGVQNISCQYTMASQFARHLGVNKAKTIPNGAQIGTLSVNALIITDDYILPFTGESGFNAFLLQDRKVSGTNYSFTSGFLTSYNSRGSIGEIPQINADFSIFGQMGRLVNFEPNQVGQFLTISGGSPTGWLKIPGPGSIDININDFATNRCQNYDVTIEVPRNPIYYLGSRYPKTVKTNYPYSVQMNFTIEVDDLVEFSMRDFPCAPKTKNISLTVRDYNSNEAIVGYYFNNMQLTNETHNIDINGAVTVNQTYETLLTRGSNNNVGSSSSSSS